jgi:phage-related holin
MNDEAITKWFWGGAGAVLNALWASVGTSLLVYGALALLDALTAGIANGKLHQFHPEAGTLGWKRKVNLIILILAVAILQQGVEPGILAQFFPHLTHLPAAETIAGIFSAYEILSIARNYLYTGGWMPKILKDAMGIDEENLPKNPPEGLVGFLGTPKWLPPEKKGEEK